MNSTLLYNYAHMVLPFLALGNPGEVYEDLSGSAANQFLVSIWKDLESFFKLSQSHEGLHLAGKIDQEDYKIFVVQLPKPTASPEAFYIGVAFKVTEKILKTEVISARYFTLELGLEISTRSELYFFCEWEGVENKKHINMGVLPARDEQTFINEIEKALLHPNEGF